MENNQLDTHNFSKFGLKVFNLDVAREGNSLKISVYEQITGESSTIKHYEDIPVSLDKIEKRCHEIIETLNETNRNGRITPEIFIKLKEVGQVFYDELFSQNAKEKLRRTRAEYLRLHIDDQLVQIPWELLYDGEQFLCQRFNMGRLVKTRQSVPQNRERSLAGPLKMLLIADPKSDLNGAYREGVQIRNYMDRHKNFIQVSSQFDNISADSIKEKIRNYDLVHFAGHADYNAEKPVESGWRLTKGSLKAGDIMKMAGASPMPALIFSNACQSARTEKWALSEYFQEEIFGLANAFLLSGVKHYIGTFCEILDEPSSRFALRFYEHLRCGRPVGEAVRLARIAALREEYGEENIVWASYILYGDPTVSYADRVEQSESEKSPKIKPVSKKIRTPDEEEEVIVFNPRENEKKRWGWWAIIIGMISIISLIVAGLSWMGKHNDAYFMQKIAAAEDQAHRTILKEIREKMLIVMEQEKKKQIEKNIKALEHKIPHGKSLFDKAQRSESLTMMIDFRSGKYSLIEGKEELIALVIAEQILQHTNVQLVERKDLDKVLEELNFGTSKLIDPANRLSLGKIMAAKLILSGWVEDSGRQTEISMRVSEIETGRTIAAVNEVLDSNVPVSAQKHIAKKLLKKLNELPVK
ncbi:Curli production assembly/transport component CsgG [Candidatus Magnetomoraceae bacterium gMMP-1]